MDNLNNIPNAGNWGDAASKLNDNFNKVKQAVTTIENASKNNKGYFSSLSALNTAFPSPKTGQTAYVYSEASSTKYYIYNAFNGGWVTASVEAPSVGVDISGYAKTGGSTKTLKEVEDENILTERTNLRYHNAWTLRGYAAPDLPIPSNPSDMDAYIPLSSGTVWGQNVVNRSEQVFVYNSALGAFELHWLFDTDKFRMHVGGASGYIYFEDNKLIWSNISIYDSNSGKRVYITDGVNAYDERNEIELQLYDSIFVLINDFGAAENDGSISVYINKWNKYAQRKQKYSIGSVLSLVDPKYRYGAIFDLIDKSARSERQIIKLDLERGAISGVGSFGTNYYGKQYYRTSRFIDVSQNNFVVLNVPQDLEVRISRYDKNFQLIDVEATPFTPVFAGDNRIILEAGVFYLKLTFRKSPQLEDLPEMVCTLTGAFPENYNRFNIRPVDGYTRLIIPVNVADATASDNTSNDVQDTENILPDYGLLVLPETYQNNGEPTRLIIYCHGAGVNYEDDISVFPPTDIQPEYWLSEGYAVMDIEGNPFNNIDEHFYIPQAIQSYIAAYEWVIKNFNIKRDGVFLGGRSMGGGMVFEILQSRIPVIAACPLVPTANTLLAWNYCNAARRAFLADKLGFTGTPPTWTSTNPMTVSEWQYLQDNFEKMVKYSPLWRGIENLPSKETLFDGMRIASNVPYDENEAALYENLTFRVKSPIKIFAVMDDATMVWRRNAELMYKMILNGAQICELRLFETGGHFFEIDNPECLTTITNRYGQTLNNVPVVYIEMLQFWKRYENS
jgi:hypothetical protein